MDDVYRLKKEIAESWVSQSDDNSANLISGIFLEKAIKEYRTIPKKERSAFNVDERIKELHKEMNGTNILAIAEMPIINGPSTDITELVNVYKQMVTGKSFPDVIKIFSNLTHLCDFESIRKNAKAQIKNSVFYHLCSATHLKNDGRVVSKTPGIRFGSSDSLESEKIIWHEMIGNYKIHVEITVKAVIIPALSIINYEHRISESSLYSLCSNSTIIPEGRLEYWSKGLFSGFDTDFSVSIHLLIPQIENLVRVCMKSAGIKTTTLDSDGIETENGLSTLLDNSEINKAIEPNLVLEFKALLTDSIGPNLRNEIAHGLLEVDGSMSIFAVYLWWLCLKLVINGISWSNNNISKTE